MKKYVAWILSGMIVILAGILIGILLYLKDQPVVPRGVSPVVEIVAMEPDSALWGLNYPNIYSSFLLTAGNDEATDFGGSQPFSNLEKDPRQVVLFSGYSFSKDYNEERGHLNSLTDVRSTRRVTSKTAGTCYSCKSADNPRLWAEMGMVEYDQTPFSELRAGIDQPIGCANCHEAGTMRLIVTNPALAEALAAQGKDWTTFTRQEMRTLVCANCHVEYYLAGEGSYLTFPWENGTQVEDIIAYYDELGFKDWSYPGADTPMLKAQHPEYETYTADSTHFLAGVACADCHMAYQRDGAAKFSSHNVRSPLQEAERACGQCHTDVEFVIARVEEIQDSIFNTKLAAEDAIIDAIVAIQTAAADPVADETLLNDARGLHRQAQFLWDFVSAENSMGFHNPEYSLSILARSIDLARQAQMKAAQAVHDPALLQTGIYYTIDPVPMPVP